MEKRFISYLQEIIAQPEQKRFLLAVSGGVDSSVLVALFFENALLFDIAHCNFHLREEASDQDMAFVKAMGEKYGCEVFVKEFFPADFEKRKGKSTEMIAREMRYEWFETFASRYDYIITAHHANDNAETVLLNLARGTGLKGMTGIPSINGKIARPLLPFSSREIEEYAGRHHILYRDDHTNFTEEYHRNKIRWSVIPKLEEINPNLIRTMTRNISVFHAQYEFYRKQVERLKTRLLRPEKEKYYISIEKLSALEDKEVVLYEILSDFHFNIDTVRDIIGCLQQNSGKQFFSPTHVLVKDRLSLILSPVEEGKKEKKRINNIKELEENGFEVELLTEYDKIVFSRDQNIFFTEARLFSFPLVIRTWEQGDYFYPFGMKGRKKVSDFFNDLKIDILTKQKIPILCCGEDIVWIVGYRSDNRYKIQDQASKLYYKIKYHGILNTP